MDDKALRKIAQTLYGGYQKDTTGKIAILKDADPQTRKVWLRTAKRAVAAVEQVSASSLGSNAGKPKAAAAD